MYTLLNQYLLPTYLKNKEDTILWLKDKEKVNPLTQISNFSLLVFSQTEQSLINNVGPIVATTCVN